MEFHTTQLIVLIGFSILASVLLRNLLHQIKLPGLIGFILFGFAIRAVDSQIPVLGKDGMEVFAVLAKLGIICLLFRVGLESNLEGLRKQLGRAGLIWLGNALISGGAGYVLARYALSLDLLLSLFLVAAGGKWVGGFVPGRFLTDTKHSALLGLSLMPRAEITMVVMSHGRTLGESVIPAEVFVGMIWVVLLTCIAGTMSTGLLVNKIKN